MNEGRQRFIEKHRAKFWYTLESSKREIGDDLLVETTLNDGTLDDFRELRDFLTPRRMAQVFFRQLDASINYTIRDNAFWYNTGRGGVRR